MRLESLFVPAPLLGYKNKALFNTFWCGVRVKTNSFGFRYPEIKIKKPDNVFRIMVLGDSIAFGWWVKARDTFSSVLERELNGKFATKGLIFEVINTGVPGYSTLQEKIFFEKEGYKFQADLVILAHCLNDLHPTEDPFNSVENKSVNPIIPKESLSVFFTFLKRCLSGWFKKEELKKISSGIIKKRNRKEFLKKTLGNWEAVRNCVLDKKSRLLIISFPQPYNIRDKNPESFFNVLDGEIKKKGFSVINFANVFAKYKGRIFDLYYEKDIFATHLSEKGHKIAGETILKYLTKRRMLPKS